MTRTGDGDRHGVGAARLSAQLLAGRPARTVEEVVARLLAVQAQDARGFRLAVRVRSGGLAAVDVERALTETRSVVVTWLNRGTLHLVAADDYWWLHPLTAPRLVTASERRLRQEGVDAKQAARGVDVVVDAVERYGPQTREQLRRRLDDARVPTAGQALVHVLLAATLRTDVVRGPLVGNHHAFVSAARWLGEAPAPLPRDEALARLARRYLAGHGPASADDLARWTGITLRDARAALDTIADDLASAADGLVTLAGRRARGRIPLARLLGPFDPLLLGWISREPFVGTPRGVVTTNGIVRPVALVDGRVVATWGLAAGVVTVTPLEPIPDRALGALHEDAADVLRFLGLPPQPAVIAPAVARGVRRAGARRSTR